jgi:hypothetical protein
MQLFSDRCVAEPIASQQDDARTHGQRLGRLRPLAPGNKLSSILAGNA